MSNWNDIFKEVEETARKTKDPHDQVRHRYLHEFSERTGRNVLAYYSGWLQYSGPVFPDIVSITDEDKNGFMACFYQMEFERGLDLFIHSPGGSVAATESIIDYIRTKFDDDVRVFVPQLSMSGGTMIALAGKEIWMGTHSNLGPIDPLLRAQPAQLVIDEFERACREIKDDPQKIHVWRPILEQIPPTFLSTCEHAISWSREIGKNALRTAMFKDDPDREEKASEVVNVLTNADINKNHSKHLHRKQCEELGLKIKKFEDDQDMQNAILCVHHAYMISLMNADILKIIENHDGISYIRFRSSRV